jgi:phage RecT family recombinase
MNAIARIDDVITSVKPSVINTIKDYQWEIIPETQLLAAKSALTKSQYIEKVAMSDTQAVADAMIKGAILGIDLTEGKRQGWLLPRKNANGKTVIQLQVGYKGVEAIHQRLGVIDRLAIRVVHENDTFDWSGDDGEKPKHDAKWFDEKSRGPIVGAFAITYFPDGAIQVVTAPLTEIHEKHRDISDSWKQYVRKTAAGESSFPPPWVTHEKAMIEKTMAFIASKQWPANIRDGEASAKILNTLHDVDTSDYVESFSQYSQEEKKIFDSLVENDDALGLHLMYRGYKDSGSIDAWTGLYNSFPRGQKMKMKEKVNELTEAGMEIESNIVRAVLNDDGLALVESVDGISEYTKKMLWAVLTKQERDFVVKATEASKGDTNG